MYNKHEVYISYKKYIGGIMEKLKREKGLYIKLTDKENEIIKNIKRKYSVNISQYLRNQIVKLEEKLKNSVGDEL